MRERGDQEDCVDVPATWASAAIRALNDAVIAALEVGDVDGARAAAGALTRLREGT